MGSPGHAIAFFCVCSLVALFGASSAQAEAKGEKQKAIDDYTKPLLLLDDDYFRGLGRRVALVIGNAAYRKGDPLPTTRKDADDIAAALRAAHFADVVVLHDLGFVEMRRALAGFRKKVAAAIWAVVYYSGHAIQMDRKNYLVPVGADLRRPSDVELETIPLASVFDSTDAARKLRLSSSTPAATIRSIVAAP